MLVIEPVVYHLRFASAFLASISMIIVSEFGDKTFFIAAIMAMRNNRLEGTRREGGKEANQNGVRWQGRMDGRSHSAGK